MFKNLVILLLFVLCSGMAQAQKKAQQPAFDMAAFMDKAATARWLYIYDKVAWWTTDSITQQPKELLQKLGKEWFCYQDSTDNWHAVYGRFDSASYSQVLHFVVDTDAHVSITGALVDTGICNPFSRAINTAYRMAWPVIDSLGLRFNHYVRFSGKEHIEVFLFPAFQQDMYAPFGGEFVYTLDAGGTKVLEDRSYYQGKFRAVKANAEQTVLLDYSELEEPTLGGIFYLWYYKKYFKQIYLRTQTYTHTLYKSESGPYSWLHLQNPKEKPAKKPKRK